MDLIDLCTSDGGESTNIYNFHKLAVVRAFIYKQTTTAVTIASSISI